MSTPSATSTDPPTTLHGVGFDPAALDAALDAIRGHLDVLATHMSALGLAATRAAHETGVPPETGAVMSDLAGQITTAADHLGQQVLELLQGAAAPLLLFRYAAGWGGVRGGASDVAGRLRPDQLPARSRWKGVAADRYTTATTTQSTAAARIATTAAAVAPALATCAGAGLMFYLSVGVILAQVIRGLAAAVVAFGSAAFSWAGVLLGLESVTVGAGLIVAAVTTLTALLGVELGTVNALRGELVDHGQFPAGHWPSAVTDTYTDATVTDGNAEWSVQP